jgi:predicted RNA-binding protein YlqC (UPF0109 family)
VDHPAQVRVSGVEGENSLIIELGVAKADMRTILHASWAQKDKRHVLEVLE